MKMKRREFLAGSLAGLGEVMLSPHLKAADEASKTTHFDVADIVTLGKTKIKTSRVGLGTGMRGGNRQSNHTRMGKEKFEALIRAAYDRGIRLFDLADLYGTHPYLIPALKKVPRKQYEIITKIWYRKGGIPEKERPDANVVVERFLKELRTDYIDVMQIHCMTSDKWTREMADQMEIMAKLKKRGLIRSHGVSCHSLSALKLAANDPWVDTVHVRINAYGDKMDAPPSKVLPVMEEMRINGKGIIGMKLVGEGNFRHDDHKKDYSLKLVLNRGLVDGMVVGFEKIPEIHDFAKRVRKIEHKKIEVHLPSINEAAFRDTSSLSRMIGIA